MYNKLRIMETFEKNNSMETPLLMLDKLAGHILEDRALQWGKKNVLHNEEIVTSLDTMLKSTTKVSTEDEALVSFFVFRYGFNYLNDVQKQKAKDLVDQNITKFPVFKKLENDFIAIQKIITQNGEKLILDRHSNPIANKLVAIEIGRINVDLNRPELENKHPSISSKELPSKQLELSLEK